MPDDKITPTDEQQAIIDQAASPSSLMISAYAGCSKTTTLQLAAPKIRVPALALAFNKRIAQELAPRLPGNFTVKTLNALGHAAWARAQPQITRLVIDDRKLGKLVTQVAKDRKVQLASDQWDGIRRLVAAAMQVGLVPENAGTPLVPDSPELWHELADDLWISPDEQDFHINFAEMILHENILLAKQGTISFDDQIYCSTCLGGKFARFPVVFVDESQDLSPLNHQMLQLSSATGGKIIAVGDQKQAIYQFRGADSRSMQTMRRLSSDWMDLPLATTFRCPKVIVERQRQHAPGFRAWHTNADGRFQQFTSNNGTAAVDLDGGWSFASLQQLLPASTATLAVLCRNNAPLLSLAFKLIRRGIGPVMLGRDIGKGLVSLSKQIAPDDSASAATVAALVADWSETQCSIARASGKEEKIAGITDRAECLQATLQNAGVLDAGGLRLVLEKLFSRDSGQVTLSSIHRAKGLEWDCVMHLDPWRIPSKYARQAAERGGSSQLEQEWNLRYVCETRTKHTLVLASLVDFH